MKKIIGILGIILVLGSCKETTFSPEATSNIALPKPDGVNLRTKEENDKLFELFKMNNSDESLNNDYEIIDGVVHIKNFDVLGEIIKESDKFKKEFQDKNKGFNSLENLYNAITIEGENLKNNEQGKSYLNKYSDFVEIKNEILTFKYKSTFSFLLNRDRVLYVGKCILYFDGDSHYMIYDGDKTKIKDIENKKLKISNTQCLDIKADANKKAKVNSCTHLTGDFTAYNNRRGFSSCEYTGGWKNPTGSTNGNGEQLYQCFLKVKVEGQMLKKVLWWWQAYTPNNTNELTVNYKANIYLFGNLIASDEPNYTDYNQQNYISAERVYSQGLILTENEAQPWNLTVSIEERAGRLFNWDLSGAAVWYTCH